MSQQNLILKREVVAEMKFYPPFPSEAKMIYADWNRNLQNHGFEPCETAEEAFLRFDYGEYYSLAEKIGEINWIDRIRFFELVTWTDGSQTEENYTGWVLIGRIFCEYDIKTLSKIQPTLEPSDVVVLTTVGHEAVKMEKGDSVLDYVALRKAFA